MSGFRILTVYTVGSSKSKHFTPNAIQLAKILKFGLRMVQIWNGWLHSFINSCSYGYGPDLSKSEQKMTELG